MSEFSPNPVQVPQRSKAQILTGLFALKSLIEKVASLSIDLLFPPRCAGCGQIDTVWCATCQTALDQLPFATDIDAHLPLSAVAAAAWHNGIVREAVQALKYDNAQMVAKTLGNRLAACLEQQNWSVDIIIPVPLHTKRLSERGYNQARLLAEQVAAMTGIPCQPEGLRRIRETQSQVTMSGAERLTNISDAFEANSPIVNGQVILIVDDVYTTGSTLGACGEALIKAGAERVFGLTVTAAGHPFTHKKETVDEHHHTRA